MNEMRIPACRFDLFQPDELEQKTIDSSKPLNINLQETFNGRSPIKRREKSPESPSLSPVKKRKLNDEELGIKKISEAGLNRFKMNDEDNFIRRNSTPPTKERLSKCPTPIKLLPTEKGAALISDCSIFNDKGDSLITKGEVLNLTPIGEGKFHKVWTCEGKDFVIKTWRGLVADVKKKESYQDTIKAYDLLISQAEAHGNFHVAKLYNKDTVWKDGFYVYEYIQGREPTFEDVKALFIEMVKDSSRYIADFRPANAIIQTIQVVENEVEVKKNQIVLIDPSIEKKHEKDYDLHLATSILTWMVKKDKSLDEAAVNQLIAEFNDLVLSPVARENWTKTAERLIAKCAEVQKLNQNI